MTPRCDHEAITGQAAGLVDQGRGGRPAGLVERGGVHRGQDSIERVVFAHDRACPLNMEGYANDRIL